MVDGVKIAGGRLVRKQGAPTVLDLLVVGAGPTGCAAALAAAGTGLGLLMIDRDDILSRARDGGGPVLEALPDPEQAWPFGDAGALLHDLVVAGPKPETWKTALNDREIPYMTGVELKGLKAMVDGTYKASLRFRDQGTVEVVHARRVLLAPGSGLPLDGTRLPKEVARALTDPQTYLGEPVCVLGGGRSALTAALQLSAVKAQAGDPHPVFLTCAGVRFPRHDHEQTSAVHHAMVERGNLHFYPGGRLAGCDEEGQVLIALPGVSWERPFLVIPARACIAFDQPDYPVEWLDQLGINSFAEGDVFRPCLGPLLHTGREGLFLAGSVLSPYYYDENHRRVTRSDHLLQAVVDGMTVAHQIISGPPEQQSGETSKPEPVGEPKVTLSGTFVVRLKPDGTHGEYYPLSGRGLTIGKKNTNIVFPEDGMLSDTHASVLRRRGRFLLRDEDSNTGVFLKLPAGEKLEITKGDLIRLGGQFLLFDCDEQFAWAQHYDSGGHEGARYVLSAKPTILGAGGDNSLDDQDPALASHHLSAYFEDNTFYIRDLMTFEGSYLRLLKERVIDVGAVFMVGHEQLLLWEEGARAVPVSAPGNATGMPAVTIDGHGGPYPCEAGQALVEIAAANGIDLPQDCLGGGCGCDPVRLISGMENVNGADDLERETLREICGLGSESCRLACKLRIFGPVRLKLP